MAKGVAFTREELALLHETLSYASKRTFSEGEKARLKDLISRVEERLLNLDGPPRPFGVTEPEVDAFVSAVDIYCDALHRPLSAEVSRHKARRVQELVGRFRRRPGFLQKLRELFGRG